MTHKEQVEIARTRHFELRVLERYGFKMGEEIRNRLKNMIETADEGVLLVDDNRFPHNEFLIDYAHMKYRVIYNMVDHMLVTALPYKLHTMKAENKKRKKFEKSRVKQIYNRKRLERLEIQND